MKASLHASLGTTKVIWLPGGLEPAFSITDGHVDGIMTFVKPGLALFNVSDDAAHPNFHELNDNLRALQLATDARGRKLDIMAVAQPREVPSTARHFCARYVNCLIVNGAVLLPEFADVRYDERARAVFSAAFAGRSIVPLRIDAIAEGGGGIHCITQQQPRVSSSYP